MTVRDLFLGIAVSELVICAVVGLGRVAGFIPPLGDTGVVIYCGAAWVSVVILAELDRRPKHKI